MRAILLILIGFSVLNADFIKTGDIVKDTVSKLEWQDDAISTALTWTAAIGHCENLTLGGYSDWRLPNINELKSIVDRSKDSPAIVNGFVNTGSTYYWSSTTNEGSRDYAWIVEFNSGSVYHNSKDSNSYVRCVRDGE